MNDNLKKILATAREVAFRTSFDALNTAVCSFVARKVNYMIDAQEQKKIQKEERDPPPEKQRLGFHRGCDD